MHFVYHEQRTWRCDMSVRERSWQASEARNNFPELMKRALAGAPQVVRHRSGQEVVVVSRVDYEALRPTFKEYLLRGGPCADDDDDLDAFIARNSSDGMSIERPPPAGRKSVGKG